MSNTATVKIGLEVDDKGTIKIRQFSGELDKMGKTGKTGFAQVQSGAQATLSTLMKFGGAVMGIMAVRAAIDKMVAAGHEWIDLAEIQEKAETRLQAVLMSTGHAAGFNLDQLKAMASGMQNVTTVGDEVILSGMSILATFKNVRQEAFERATMAALDMSEVMGQDLKSSMVQLGKALNDPVQGITALTRVGVSFTDEQKNMIKSFVESGNIMAAQNIILQELESEFGGAAKAASETFGGAVTQAENALGDFKEELGFVITKNQFFIDLAHLATQTFADWGGKIQDNRQYLMELAKDGVLWVVDALINAIATVGEFQVGWLNLKGVFWTVVDVLAKGMQYVLDGLHQLLSPLELIYDGMVKLGLLDFNPLSEAMDSLQGGLQSVAKYSEEAAKQAAADALETEQGYQKVIDTLVDMRGKIASIPVTQVKADKAIVKSNAKAQKLISKNNDKTHKKTLKQIEAEKKAREKAEKEKQKIVQDFNKKYQQLVLGRYEFEREQIRLQAEAYIKAGADKIKVAKWAEAEIKKINQEEVEATKEAYRRQVLASQDFFEGMKLGWEDLTDHQRTWAKTGYDIVHDFAEQSASTMSDVLFDAITKDMKGLEDYWDAFWRSMLKSMTNYVGQMATQWATSKLVEWGAGFVDTLMSFHTGLVDLKQDELLAVLQEGEMVIPAKQAEAIRTAIASEGMSESSFFDKVVGAVSAGSKRDFGIDSWGNPDVAGIAAAKFTSAVLGGVAAGASNYAKTMQMASSLQKSGFNIDMSEARDMAFHQGALGFVSSTVGGFAGGMIGDLGSYALGVKEYASAGKLLNFGLAMLAGVSLPGAFMAALSPISALAVSAIADVFDLRENETLRDALEDDYGAIAGRRAYQKAKDVLKGMGAKISDLGTFAQVKDPYEKINTIKAKVPFGSWIDIDLENGLVTNEKGQIGINGKWYDPVDSGYAKELGNIKDIPSAVGFGSLKDVFSDFDKINQEVEKTFRDIENFAKKAAKEAAKESRGTGSAYEASGWGSSHEGAGGWGGPAQTGGGTPGHEPGGQFGMATGGIINRLVVPQGEDGWIAAQFGEGVISRKGMEFLDAINSGQMPGGFANIAAEIKALRQEIRATQIELIKTNKKLYRLHQKWDVEGVKTQ